MTNRRNKKSKGNLTGIFKAMNDKNKIKTQYTANEDKQARIIANHFKKQFRKDKSPRPDQQPTPMKIPFSKRRNIQLLTQKQ